jgi:diguanylate cyclase (GGDEF)-like protein
VEGIIIVENLKYVGFLDTKSLLKALNEKNIAYARDQNPLTKLPGNTLIFQYLSDAITCIDSQFIFVYFDFNNFKPYNDKFGFRNGDRVILLFAEILKKRQLRPEIFIGHIGGDDFFLGIQDCKRDSALDLIRNIRDTFNQDVQSFYGPDELRNGYIIATDRDERERQFPLLTVSAAVIEFPINRARTISNSEIGELIAQEKKKAKKRPDKISIITIA